MTTLKEAQEKGKLKDFIKEHKKDPKGDKEKFDKLMKSISSQSQSKAPQASLQDKNEN
jgi:ferritin-like metal-binding protein YciE